MTRLKSFCSGVLAFAFAPYAQAQISEQTQDNLASMAQNTLLTSESLEELSKAAEVLALLKRTHQTQKYCKHISKLVYEGDDSQPSVIYSRATLYRDLKCPTLQGVSEEINSLVTRITDDKLVGKMDIEELYYAYRLMRDANVFGAKTADENEFVKQMSARATSDWLINFNPTKWTFKQHTSSKDAAGETSKSIVEKELDPSMLRMVEMLSYVLVDQSIKKKGKEVVDKAFFMLIEKAVPESSAFFISKNVKDRNSLELTQSALRAFDTYQLRVEYEQYFDELDKSAFRDYFINKASSSSTLQQAATALRALDELTTKTNLPIAKVMAGQTLQLGGTGSVTLQLFDVLGNAIGAGGENLMQVLLEYPDGKLVDASNVSTLDGSAGRVKVAIDRQPDLPKGTFKIRIKFGSKVWEQAVTKESVRAATTLKLIDFSYELTKNAKPSDELKDLAKKQWSYPQSVASLDKVQGTDEELLHFTAGVELTDATKLVLGHPDQVYLAFKRIDSLKDDQLQINAQALWSSELGKFYGYANFAEHFDLVNGKYSVSLISIDTSAEVPASWSLGTLEVWFKEGQSDANNQRMNKSYSPKREIIAEFPPKNEQEKNPILPAAFVVAIFAFFVYYMLQQQKSRANFRSIDTWGCLMMANIALILYVITMFWLSVNLIDTLWRLLFLAPVTLFVVNKGLAGSANCDIPNKII